MKKIAIIVSGLLVLGLGIFFLTNRTVGATLPVAGQTYTLAGSGTTGSATSITLSSLTIPQTGYELVDSDFSDTFYITFEPGSRQRQEIASCTTVTQNANNTATLSGCTRGLLPFTPFTASSSYQFAHGGGTSVIFSDPPQLFNQFLAADNTSTITGLYTFTQLPLGPTSTPTNQQQFVTLYQFQQATTTGGINGSETAKGVWEGATQAEMAAGTVFGSTGATLVALNKYATSTGPGAGGVAGYHFPVTDSDGYLNASFCGKAFGCAALDGNQKVYQNPQSAQTTSTANGIPLADSYGRLGGWLTRYGSGADGALLISSGTTTIDLGGQAVFTKNYTSFTINGTGALAFSNANVSGTLIVIRTQGNFIVTSTALVAIDLRKLGGQNGTGGVNAGGGYVPGTNGKQFTLRVGGTNNQFGLGAINETGQTGGTSTDIAWQNYFIISTSTVLSNSAAVVMPGSGGGGGASGNDGGTGTPGNGGAGGDGAGALIAYIGGAYQVSSTINLSGEAGTAGTTGDGGQTGGGGGGGGGAGGMFVAFYNYLISDTGTYTVTGGSAGSGGTGAGGSGQGGGGGAGAASVTTNGGASSAGTVGDGGAGGAGKDGFAVRIFDYN